MPKILVSLIGHQTLPLLLVIKQLKPDKVILLSSNKTDVLDRKNHLSELLSPGIVFTSAPVVDPWNIEDVPRRLQEFIEDQEIEGAEFICDVTGGTKAMSIGLAHFAEQHGYGMIYLESDNGDPLLQSYIKTVNGISRPTAPTALTTQITIDEFLFAYLGKFDTSPHPPQAPNSNGALFETDVRKAFEATGLLDEIKYGLKTRGSEEIDIVLRKGNRFAIVECKQGNSATDVYGILQLNNLASERHLGIYTRKIFVVARNYRKDSRDNAKVADEHGVHLLEVPDWQPGHQWTAAEMGQFHSLVEFVFKK